MHRLRNQACVFSSYSVWGGVRGGAKPSSNDSFGCVDMVIRREFAKIGQVDIMILVKMFYPKLCKHIHIYIYTYIYVFSTYLTYKK